MLVQIRVSLWVIAALLCGHVLEGAFEPHPLGGFHEAFISKDNGPPVFESHVEPPPSPLSEKTPQQPLPNTIWIPGYWTWAPDTKEYIWMTGTWRIPPPRMQWIPSTWIHLRELGWARLKGFWSEKPLEELSHFSIMPPDPIEEHPEFSESTSYFWHAGYWSYSEKDKSFEWIGGTWELLDPNWILVPAHYEWRPKGYFFIPAYWDWPIGRRGVGYTAIDVPVVNRSLDFTPVSVLEEKQLYSYLLRHYPDYLNISQHIYHYRPEQWPSLTPTWWQWLSWWSIPWKNHWGLWWWYTHPGYPRPIGLSEDIAERVRPANPRLLQMMKDTNAPFIISQRGVVSVQAIFEELFKSNLYKKDVPVLPANQSFLEKIRETAWKGLKMPSTSNELQDIEPARSGKLYGTREYVSASKKAEVKKSEHVVVLPRKPVLTPADLEPMQRGEDSKKPRIVKIKSETSKIELVPVDVLKKIKGPAGKDLPRLAAPDMTIIPQIQADIKKGPPTSADKRKEGAKKE